MILRATYRKPHDTDAESHTDVIEADGYEGAYTEAKSRETDDAALIYVIVDR